MKRADLTQKMCTFAPLSYFQRNREVNPKEPAVVSLNAPVPEVWVPSQSLPVQDDAVISELDTVAVILNVPRQLMVEVRTMVMSELLMEPESVPPWPRVVSNVPLKSPLVWVMDMVAVEATN